MNPAISVITSTFNNAGHIVQSIESILQQTFGNFEFLVVNDGSTDGTLRIIQEYASRDKRITVINNQHNLGLTKSLNVALRVARGKYIARQDADDISLPERFKKQCQYMDNNPEIFLCGSNAIIIDEAGNELGTPHQKKFYREQSLIKKLKKTNQFFHSSLFFKNDHILYREKFYYSQDYDFVLNLVSNKKHIAMLPEPLIKWRLSAHSISGEKAGQQQAFAELAKQFYRERLSAGSDGYDRFDPTTILKNKNIKYFNKNIPKDTVVLLLANRKYDQAKTIFLQEKNINSFNVTDSLLLGLFVNFPFTYKAYRIIRYGK